MRRFRVESKDRNAVEVEVGETERGFQHAPIHGLVFAERLHLNWQRGGQPAHPVEADALILSAVPLFSKVEGARIPHRLRPRGAQQAGRPPPSNLPAHGERHSIHHSRDFGHDSEQERGRGGSTLEDDLGAVGGENPKRAGVAPFKPGLPALAARSSQVPHNGRKRRSCSPWLALDDFPRAPWKGARSWWVRIPPATVAPAGGSQSGAWR